MDSTLLMRNALFFGASVVLIVVLALVLARLTGRLLGLGLRLVEASKRPALQVALEKRVSRVVVLLATAACVGLAVAAILLSLWQVEAGPYVWAWTQGSWMIDPATALARAGELAGLVLVAVCIHQLLRVFASALIKGLQYNAAFAQHGRLLTLLLLRLLAALRWGVLLGALLLATRWLGVPEAVRDPLTVATYIVLGVLVARTLAVVADVGVDVVVQLIRAFEGHQSPLRYLGRLEHLGGITKRTLEYFCFVGAATWVLHQLRPDTWLAEIGLVAIRLIALVYVGRVLIEVCGLLIREVLLADPHKRSEAENQQRLTLVPVASSLLRYGVYFCISVMALQEVGVDTSPILAGAGLLGLAVGLGAQTLVGDIVSGFFILFEGMFLVGDRIRIGDITGNVEEIGVRVLKLRDEFGVLHCIPNGEVRSVANHTHTFVNAVVELSVPYGVDMPALLARLRAHITEIRPQHADIQGDTEFVVQELRESSALIRCLTRVKPGCDDAISEVIRAELLTALVASGVAPQACHVIRLEDRSRGADKPAERSAG